jgi:HEPN domain-containing protein
MSLNDKAPEYWYELAKHDRETVETLIRERGHPEIIIYHMHQSIEKQLKGKIIAAGAAFPFIHDIERLYKILLENEKSTPDLEGEIILMQSFYLDTRYPQADFLNQDDLIKAHSVFTKITQALATPV